MIRPAEPISRATALRRASRRLLAAALAGLALLGATAPAAAAPHAAAWLVFDARTGEVLARNNADQLWYPASVTKLMTTWVTLQAIRAGRITPRSLVPMTPLGARQAPSKMGFKPGEVVTVDNALKIIMVKSANDVSMALAEFVGGSREGFIAEMNRQARMLGMTSTRWSNPNGLPDQTQVSTARDLGLLARALLREFPEADHLWRLPGIQIGEEIIRNHNHLIDRYPGADGMKTGFICSSGFNVVASATRGHRRLIAVVLGARSARGRAEVTAELFDKSFEGNGEVNLFGRFSVPETVDHMSRGPEAGNPVRDVKQDICGPKRKGDPDPDAFAAEATTPAEDPGAIVRPGALVRPGTAAAAPAARVSRLSARFDVGPPVRVWVGGPEDAPSDGSTLLALAPDPSIARVPIFAAPAAAAAAAAPVAIPRLGAIGAVPPTGPGAGAGLGAALKPADGRPLSITPGGAPARAAAPPPPTRTAARPPATTPATAKTAAKPTATARPPAQPTTASVKKPDGAKGANPTRPAAAPPPKRKSTED